MKNYLIAIVTLLLLPILSNAQGLIKGVIKDADGTTLPGVNILVQGTERGTITDIDGAFQLADIIPEDYLEISFIGFETQIVPVGQKRNFEITLAYELSQLDEIVVIGYGTARKKDLTGSLATVDSEDLISAPTANYDEALAGRVAGVMVTSSEGTPGSPMNIVIRGGNSITGSNAPLYVIDGVPLEDFDPATINTEDIKEFNILKDASATAIYGSRGANGVIVITTKSGSSSDGTTTVNVSAAYGMQDVPRMMELLSPYEYVKYRENQLWARERWEMNSSNMDKFQKFYGNWVNPEYYRNTEGKDVNDWLGQMFRDQAPIQRYNLSVQGGNKDTNIYYSGNYTDQEGVVITTGFTKLVNNLRINHKISKKSNIAAGLLHSYSNRVGPSMRENDYSSVLRDAGRFRPVEPIIPDGTGPGGFDPDDSNQSVMFPPIQNVENTSYRNIQNVIRGNVRFTHKFHKNLTLNLSANYQGNNTKDDLFFGENTRAGQNSAEGIQGRSIQTQANTLASSNTLRYAKKWGKHNFSIMGGFEALYYERSMTELKNGGMLTDDLGMHNIGIGSIATLAQSSWTGHSLLSYFGRMTYDFSEKYLITANLRADGSSKFRGDNQWGIFPSVSAAWRIGDEELFKNIDKISNMKLRGGWGVTGNNRIADFASYNQIGIGKWNGYNWGPAMSYTPGAVITNLAAPDLRWESTQQINIGFDMGLFDSRLELTVDAYQKNTYDLLLNANMALSTGFNRVFQNVGEVENRGIEFSLSTVNIDKGGFKWTSNFNIATNQNKVVKLNSGEDAIYTRVGPGQFQEDLYIQKVGHPVGSMYGLQFDRLYQTSDFNYDNNTGEYILKDGVVNNGRGEDIAPGGVMYKDINGDGVINADDRVIIGNPNPDHFGGLNNTFSYKGFTLNVLFQWAYGFDVMNATNATMGIAWPTQMFNATSQVANHWTPYNTNTNVNATSFAGSNGTPIQGNRMDSRFIEDGSYIRLKTVALSYGLPKKVLKRMKMKGMVFTVSGQNLFTWTNYSGFDPEVGIAGNGVSPNYDYFAYPIGRTVLGTVKLTF
ncbi:TonB-dependent receptor [Flammeovirga sp. MY04]|uniref:SusC/RagA family TonB-linked outer membrane protein n=1 Tax=Flammeovirga sp. MY04 TaxID=1191459 RepID=UPI0008062ACF|nr:TonB-dependent receptor [Flammeovirga sp. MY04]ANQ52471.1 TonB-dependent receptor [Flammeovirga sp. MY04]